MTLRARDPPLSSPVLYQLLMSKLGGGYCTLGTSQISQDTHAAKENHIAFLLFSVLP